jgi:hypothetical protein
LSRSRYDTPYGCNPYWSNNYSSSPYSYSYSSSYSSSWDHWSGRKTPRYEPPSEITPQRKTDKDEEGTTPWNLYQAVEPIGEEVEYQADSDAELERELDARDRELEEDLMEAENSDDGELSFYKVTIFAHCMDEAEDYLTEHHICVVNVEKELLGNVVTLWLSCYPSHLSDLAMQDWYIEHEEERLDEYL